MKNIKQQFLTAVRILAPENDLILKLAQRIPEEQLPAYPGGAALEFVAALEKFSPNRCSPVGWFSPVWPASRRRCPGGQPRQQLSPASRHRQHLHSCRANRFRPASPIQSTNPLIH